MKTKQFLCRSSYVRTVAVIAAVAMATGLALYGSGGAVSVISTNTVSGSTFGQYRVEASSSLSSSWVTSWSEYAAPQSLTSPGPSAGYTSAWNGAFWTAPVSHVVHSTDVSGNLFLTTDPSGRHVLVGLDAAPGANAFDLFLQISTDSTGQTWGAPIFPLPSGAKADFPSVAVAANGTIGIAFNELSSGNPIGEQVTFSTNGGATWSTPVNVTSSGSTSFGRIVAAGNTFSVFIPDLSGTTPSNPAPQATLRRYEWNGSSWFLAQNLMTYTSPAQYSPGSYTNSSPGNPNNGFHANVGYSPFIDAQATSAGWAVLWQAGRPDNPATNNMLLCTQSHGCTWVSYATDLILGGVTTSQNGDLWVSLLTYSGNPGTVASPNRNLPLQQVASYGNSSFSFVSGVPNSNIDPTSWIFYNAFFPGSKRCDESIGSVPCFSPGDYFRLAMNTFTGATLPFTGLISTSTPILQQTFVQDPAKGLPPLQGLTFVSVALGTDMSSKQPLALDELTRHMPRTRSPWLP